MPDKKLTDNDIIKTLEESISFDEPYESNFTLIRIEYIKNALDLINRLQAENERLKEENKILDLNRRMAWKEKEVVYKIIKPSKAEAYKECVRLLIAKANVNQIVSIDGEWAISQRMANNLLKELVGESK